MKCRRWSRTLTCPRNRLLAVSVGAPGAVDRETRNGRRARTKSAAAGPKCRSKPFFAARSAHRSSSRTTSTSRSWASTGKVRHAATRRASSSPFGTGIGAGIMVNGQLYHGHHFLAGEIGLMCMGPQFVDVDFGSRGCLETLTGLGALKAQWHRDAADSPEWLADLFSAAANGDARGAQDRGRGRDHHGHRRRERLQRARSVARGLGRVAHRAGRRARRSRPQRHEQGHSDAAAGGRVGPRQGRAVVGKPARGHARSEGAAPSAARPPPGAASAAEYRGSGSPSRSPSPSSFRPAT